MKLISDIVIHNSCIQFASKTLCRFFRKILDVVNAHQGTDGQFSSKFYKTHIREKKLLDPDFFLQIGNRRLFLWNIFGTVCVHRFPMDELEKKPLRQHFRN